MTHAHADHAAGVTALVPEHSQARFHKYPWPEEDARFAVAWMSLAEGDRVAAGDTGLVVLHTPGHSPDHCAFWHEPSGSIFTGDLVRLGGSVAAHLVGKSGQIRPARRRCGSGFNQPGARGRCHALGSSRRRPFLPVTVDEAPQQR